MKRYTQSAPMTVFMVTADWLRRRRTIASEAATTNPAAMTSDEQLVCRPRRR